MRCQLTQLGFSIAREKVLDMACVEYGASGRRNGQRICLIWLMMTVSWNGPPANLRLLAMRLQSDYGYSVVTLFFVYAKEKGTR
jgi:hypothetical protein